LGLQTLIDNLLESASIEAGRFHVSPRPSDLKEIMAEVAQTLQPLLVKHGQSLKLALPARMPKVQIDPRRTAQVLVNLLSNASKYSPDQTEIVMQAQVEGTQIKVMIIDQGPGILPEYRQNLFHRFVYDKVSNSKDRIRQAGTGLGLSVVKAVVEAQGGQVGVADATQGGSIFWFTVPIAGQI
jgi:K+-sensing histidine kinase KdpD